ncbi:DUF397 domain-containing protein [Saccharopolyspora rosea]|uniref:DUF397 domain-containing protein n=1 Tax=Saccharopolyspora rosea TaxID=524884 RepID=UPI0021D9F138|nr:DUF397 domain-containing protein [Saccharopolyspora rosea]
MATVNLSTVLWRKSSRSTNYGNCVEVAFAGHAVAARDSKDPDGGSVLFAAETWTAFIRDLKAGRFDV